MILQAESLKMVLEFVTVWPVKEAGRRTTNLPSLELTGFHKNPPLGLRITFFGAVRLGSAGEERERELVVAWSAGTVGRSCPKQIDAAKRVVSRKIRLKRWMHVKGVIFFLGRFLSRLG